MFVVKWNLVILFAHETGIIEQWVFEFAQMGSKGRGMENWDEVRTAVQVAREGTVSGAANVLGVHHATVIRHIDALEQRLGVKLFQRHSRGYTPTEAGEEMMRVGQATAEQFSALEGRLRGKSDDVSGELVITTLAPMAYDLVPILSDFQHTYPEIKIKLLASERLFKLEYGEAHIAIRAGEAPQEPDNIVQPYRTYDLGLFASREYIEKHGHPTTLEDFASHRFVGRDNITSRAPFFQWQQEHIPASAVYFRASNEVNLAQAIRGGIGIGFLECAVGNADPNLVQVWPSEPAWQVKLWIVTHVDLHRTAKVQAIVNALKTAGRAAS